LLAYILMELFKKKGEAARFVLEFGAFAGPTRFRSSFALVAGPGIESIGPTRSAYTW
jgi:hypothetical protein